MSSEFSIFNHKSFDVAIQLRFEFTAKAVVPFVDGIFLKDGVTNKLSD